jgi:hypothetical protein
MLLAKLHFYKPKSANQVTSINPLDTDTRYWQRFVIDANLSSELELNLCNSWVVFHGTDPNDRKVSPPERPDEFYFSHENSGAFGTMILIDGVYPFKHHQKMVIGTFLDRQTWQKHTFVTFDQLTKISESDAGIIKGGFDHYMVGSDSYQRFTPVQILNFASAPVVWDSIESYGYGELEGARVSMSMGYQASMDTNLVHDYGVFADWLRPWWESYNYYKYFGPYYYRYKWFGGWGVKKNEYSDTPGGFYDASGKEINVPGGDPKVWVLWYEMSYQHF